MYRVELYKESHLLEATSVATKKGTLNEIDAMLTSVLRGERGVGAFRLSADRVNDLGMFEESFFDSDTFEHPAPARAA